MQNCFASLPGRQSRLHPRGKHERKTHPAPVQPRPYLQHPVYSVGADLFLILQDAEPVGIWHTHKEHVPHAGIAAHAHADANCDSMAVDTSHTVSRGPTASVKEQRDITGTCVVLDGAFEEDAFTLRRSLLPGRLFRPSLVAILRSLGVVSGQEGLRAEEVPRFWFLAYGGRRSTQQHRDHRAWE